MGNINTNSSNSTWRPPMRIHKIHGRSLKITNDNLMATRFEGYADGLFFGSRPVEREEQIEVTVRKLVKDWNGSVRFGFTLHTPQQISTHTDGIPRYMCPDLIKRGGCFVETISHISLRVGDRLVFWVTQSGEMKLKINEVQQRCQVKNINCSVWPVVDVYGNCTEVFFRSLSDDYIANSFATEPRFYSSLIFTPFRITGTPDSCEFRDDYNVKKRPNRTTKAYAWNQVVLKMHTVWVLFVKEVDEEIRNPSLSIIFMHNNPSGVQPVPDDIVGYNKRGGCTVFKDIYNKMTVGDELAICVSEDGMAMATLNGQAFEDLGKVLRTNAYWITADLNNGVTSLQSVGVHKLSIHPLPILPVFKTDAIAAITSRNEASIEGAAGGPPEAVLVSNTSSAVASATGAGTASGAAVAPNHSQTESLPPPRAASAQSMPAPPPEPQSMPQSARNSLQTGVPECVICLETRPDVAFIPCGHMVCCSPCADNMRNEHNYICPTCRAAIQKAIKIYY